MSEETKRREVCTCENCGNEAEMTITCRMVDVEDEKTGQTLEEKHETKVCTVCGNEADTVVTDV
jgi:hypothetical protein